MSKLRTLILAAGKGTRMKSKTAKVLHPVGGLPMLEFVLRSARELSDDVRVVVGHQSDAVRDAFDGVMFIDQEKQLGTGHAVMAARDALADAEGNLLVLPGDDPMISAGTLRRFAAFHNDGGFAASVLTARLDNPSGYGRVIRRSDHEVDEIIEHRDADPSVLSINEVNSSIYIFDVRAMFGALDRVRTDNAQDEYYLTDVVGILSGDGGRVGAFSVEDPAEAVGINSRSELAAADRRIRAGKCEALMRDGVSIVDPATAWIDADVEIGPDSCIYPSVALEGPSVLGEDVTVRSFSRITNSRIGDRSLVLEGSIIADSETRSDVRVGPYAHLRMGTILDDRVKVGNFVEIKKSRLGGGTKSMHLTYLGDADIGENVNVGAGTITCNYDGVRKNRTVIEDGAFIGSDSQLIAPVRVGKGAYVAAGSSINEDVPPEALAVARSRQTIKKNWKKKQKGK